MDRSKRVQASRASVHHGEARRPVGQVERDRNRRSPRAKAQDLSASLLPMMPREEFAERFAGSNRVRGLCAEQTILLGKARSLTGKARAVIDPVEEVATRLEEVDLVRGDEGPA